MLYRSCLAVLLLGLAAAAGRAEPGIDYYFPTAPSTPEEPNLDYYYPRPAAIVRASSAPPGKLHFHRLELHKRLETGNSLYADIVNHHRDAFKDFGDRSTTAHETTHGLNAFLRTRYMLALERRVNAFYLGADRFVVLDEPGIRKSVVADFVPASLRGDRFELYVQNQKEWDDTPLYIFDEWVAYVNGSEVALEEAAKKPAARSNEVFACVEFAVYATALAMAVEKHDARHFTRDEQFRAFLTWHLKRSLATYRRGAARPEFAWKPEYYRTLRSGDDGKAMREFWRQRLQVDLNDLVP